MKLKNIRDLAPVLNAVINFLSGNLLTKYVMSYGLSKWPCQGCREIIKCDFIVIQINMVCWHLDLWGFIGCFYTLL